MEKLFLFKTGLIAGLLIFGFSTLYFTHLPLHISSATDDPAQYFTSPEGEKATFTSSQIEKLNDVNRRSLGESPSADERMYCMVYDHQTREIDQLELADDIIESTTHSVEASCDTLESGVPNAWLHTHPNFSDQLSEQDRQVNPRTDLTCIQYDVIIESPTGQVEGLNCWEVDRTPNEEPEFNQLEIQIS